MKRPIVHLLLAASLTTLLCAAPSTPPDTLAWPRTMDQLSRSLTEGKTDIAAALLTKDARVLAFNSSDPHELARLVDATRGCVEISARAYIHPATTIASDLADSFRTSTDLPESIRRDMIPRDEAAMERANRIAIEWVSDNLQAEQGTPVAVIALWASQPGRVIFVLVRGQEATSASYHVARIVYGDPLATQRN